MSVGKKSAGSSETWLENHFKLQKKNSLTCHLDSLGADEVPSENLVIVSDADDVIRTGPAHAGDKLRVLGLLDVRGLEPHPRYLMRFCVSPCSQRSQNINNKSSGCPVTGMQVDTGTGHRHRLIRVEWDSKIWE